MSGLDGFVEYRKREYCHDVNCPVQVLLDQEAEQSEKYEFIRGICREHCLHTTHDFHAWLNAHGYVVVRPAG